MRTRVIVVLAAICVGGCDFGETRQPRYGQHDGLPIAKRTVETRDGWVSEFIEPKSGCRMLVHRASAPVVAPRRDGKPDCPGVE